MILPALINYYDRLDADPQGGIAQYGFSEQKVSFCVHLDARGQLIVIEGVRQSVTNAKGAVRVVPATQIVPGQAKPSGQGINPCFLWDNSAYMLGFRADDANPARTQDCFEAFRERHLALEADIDDPAFAAVCRFLKQWDPATFEPQESLRDCLGSFGVFRVDLPGEPRGFVHDRKAVRAWWVQSIEQEPADAQPEMPSLVSGEVSRVARLHEPAIKGVWGAQSSGARLVSFNEAAFTSYGKSQGANAPISEVEAFKYCTALNELLGDETRRTGIADATVVWWSEAPAEVGEGLLSMFFQGQDLSETAEAEAALAEGTASTERLRASLGRIVRGLSPELLPDAEVRFHVLGLAPNAARLSVRFWWTGPMADMIERLRQHHEDLRLEPVFEQGGERPFSISRIVRETARVHGDRPDMDTVSPVLAGELARAVLLGGPYPRSLLETIVRRVRTDGRVNHARCAIVKACILRRRRALAGPGRKIEEVPVSLNKDGPQPYQLGRLFAVLEKTQLDAIKGVRATIRDGYFGSAASTPATVFPRLVGLTRHHVPKLPKEYRKGREKLVEEIMSHLDAYPRHQSLEEQGLFQIGYYHQREDLYTKKGAPEDEPGPTSEED